MIEVGSRVKYIHVDTKEDIKTGFYPPIGTCGTVNTIAGKTIEVVWDSGTKGNGVWWCESEDVEETDTKVKVGEVRYVDLSPVIGNEIGGLRPVLIKEVYDDVVIVVPCVYNPETKRHEPHPYQIRAIDYSRVKEVVQYNN